MSTFEDVLEYGKTLLFTSLGDDVDGDILSTLWPKSWNDVQLLLKEEGYEDAKQFFICFCREEKEFTRDGKTTKKFVYDGKYSVLHVSQKLVIMRFATFKRNKFFQISKIVFISPKRLT